MGSTWRNIHNELCKMTENKKRRDDDLEQSSSSANALRNASSYRKQIKQQHSGQEHRDGGRTRMKKYVTGSQQSGKNYVRNVSYQRRKVVTNIRYDCCAVVSCRPLSGCCRFSWFLWPVFPSWLPAFFLISVVLLRIRGFCDLIWELSTATACGSCFVVFYLYFEFISSLDALQSVHNSLYLHLANEQASSVKQILFSGVMTPPRSGPRVDRTKLEWMRSWNNTLWVRLFCKVRSLRPICQRTNLRSGLVRWTRSSSAFRRLRRCDGEGEWERERRSCRRRATPFRSQAGKFFTEADFARSAERFRSRARPWGLVRLCFPTAHRRNGLACWPRSNHSAPWWTTTMLRKCLVR